jgi:putative ABC transport system permease protein
MVQSAAGRSVVASVKGVDDGYPLLGEVLLDPPLPIAAALAGDGIVAEASLLARLGIAPGERVRLGEREVTLRAVLLREPDRIGGLVGIGPRVIASRATLEASEVLVEGALVRWRHAALLPPGTDVRGFVRASRQAYADAPWRIRGSDEVEPQIRRFTDRLASYLTMAGLTSLLVGGLGVGLAVQAYLAGKTATIATLKCLGGTSGLVFRVYLTQVLILAGAGTLLGLLVGQLLPLALLLLPRQALPIDVAIGLHAKPLLVAAACGLLTALAFALWPLARAKLVSPAGLFRALVAPTRRWPEPFYLAALALVVTALAAVGVMGVPRPELGLIFVGVALGTALVLTFASGAVLTTVARLAELGPVGLRLGARNLRRPGSGAASVVIALGAGLAVLTTVALLQANLNRELTERLPDRSPSSIFIDIQPHQWAPFETIAAAHGAAILESAPMLRARIVRIKDVPVDAAPIAGNVRWTINQDRGLSWSATPPPGTELVAGSWWPADYAGPPLVSIEEDVAAGYGVVPGDTLAFNVLGRIIEGEIANIRKEIDWTSGRLGFVFMMSPGVIDRAPHQMIAAVDIPPEREAQLLDALAVALPNVTPVQIGEVVAQINQILARIAFAVQVVAAITLVTGLLVLAGAINASRRRQLYQSVLLKVLGARRAELLRMLSYEYLALGLAAGLLGATIGSIVAWATVRFVFALPWSFAPLDVGTIIVGAILLTLALGGLAIWRLMGRPAAPVLRAP